MKKKIAEFLPAPDEETVYTIPEESEEELTAAEKAAAAAVEQLSSNAEKGKTIRIYRQLGTGQETMEFVAKYPADKYSIDDLIDKMKHEYGGGDYRFMIYNEKGKLVANKLISIALRQKIESGENSGVYALLSEFMNKQDAFLRQVMAQNNGTSSRAEMLQEMMLMKGLFSGDDKGSGNVLEQIKELMGAMNLIKEMSPNQDDTGTNFGSIIKDSMPLLEILARSGTEPQYQGNPNPMNFRSIIVNRLLKACKHGETPASVAEKLCDEIPNKFVPQIEALVLSPDALDQIAVINPEVMQHGEWFTDTIEWMKGMLGHPSKFDSEFENSDPVETGIEPGNDNLTEAGKVTTIPEDESPANDIDGDSIG